MEIMKNFYKTNLVMLLAFATLITFIPGCVQTTQKEEDHDEMYDGPYERILFEVERTKDPATGRIPEGKYFMALNQTIQARNAAANSSSFITALSWTERGPDSDVTGPSNGNTRANNGITAGRIRAVMVDSTDPTHRTVWVGGVDGGLWKTNDITTAPANWILVNDFMSNLAISAITQDPRPGFQNIMYVCTGESYSNADAVRGIGVFKSTDGGVTWNHLPSTISFTYCTRILVDFQGNVYLSTRNNGLQRSVNGGVNWTDITPSGVSANICDLELSTTAGPGRLHMVTGIFSAQTYRYTDVPATVTSGSGWNTPVTPFVSFNQRAEIACSGNTLYALPVNASYQVPTIYKSTDGGANWDATIGQPAGNWASGQGWYSLSIGINPTDPDNCIVGGLDCFETTNGGTSWVKISAWVGLSGQYVHADQHNVQWYDGGTKLIFACDGGIHYSSDGGTTIRDRNEGLRLKQFYSVAIHPTTTNYFLAGAQDNGVHQLSQPGLGSSVEVTGGDGMYVAIDQDQGQYQFGSYVYNNYRRSTNNGASWSSVNFNNSGRFVNPFDYDNIQNKFYAANTSGTYLRWNNPQTGNSSDIITVPEFGGQVSAVHASPYTANRVYFGMGNGRIVQVDNADATPTAVNITPAGLAGYVNCIVTGSSDQNLLACITSYGVMNVWVSNNGGTSWTAIDGNLPDMPVRWALFHPDDNSIAYIATETGMWETDLINGASTIWTPNTTFPTVRTDMIKYRTSDRTIAAGTHGRGVWTATIPPVSGFGFITPAPATATCPPPSSMAITLATTAAGGFTNPISLSASGNPAGTTVSFTPGSVTPGNSTVVTLNSTGSLTPGSYVVTVLGVASGAPNQTVNLTYTINPGTPPSITTQPSNQTVCSGTSATFSVVASGATGYQWQLSTNGGGTYNDISGATSDVYSTGATTMGMSGYMYRVNVSGACGTSTSNAATLTVTAPPAITLHPADVTLCAGSNHTFTSTATGAVSYQWELSIDGGVNYNPIAGATSSSYALTGITAGMNGNRYRVVVTGACAPTATSNAAILSVVTSVGVTTHPSNVTTCSGTSASFTVAGTGTGVLYQWQVSIDGGANYNDIPGETNATYTINAVTPVMDGFRYRARLSNSTCTTPGISNSALLTVNTLPAIATDPTSTTLCVGANNTFTALGTGTGTGYQWQLSTDGGLNFNNIAGATSSNYTVTGITAGMNGNQYRVVLSGTCSPAVTSAAATLTVVSPPVISNSPTDDQICETGTLSFSVTATGAGIIYQWQSSPDGITYTNIANGGIYSGANTATLTLTNIPSSVHDYRYRVSLSNATCTAPVISGVARLTVNPRPTVSLSGSPYTSLLPGRTTTLIATILPSSTGFNISWYRNNVLIPGATGLGYSVDVTNMGNYRVEIVNAITGCNNTSQILTIKDSASSRLFIFPSPNDGRFTVSYHNPGGNPTQHTIAVFDARGEKVYHRKLNVTGPYELHQLDLRPAAKGVYTIVIGDGTGKRLAEGKMMVQ